MNLWESILDEWLPTKWARGAAAASVTLAGSAFFLPEFMQKISIPFSEAAGLLIRISAPIAVLCVGLFAVLALVVQHSRSSKSSPAENQDSEGIVLDRADPLLSILSLVARYHSQEEKATPRRIAAELGLDPEITLAHMWKYHNDQYITFRTGGKRPELDTSFFLSPKAWHVIKVVKA